MKTITQSLSKPIVWQSLLMDILAVAFIYLVPTIAHLTSLPIYLIEPMRLMLILALVHTNKTNAIIIALTLPLFSFAISSHPVLLKMILISGELLINVLLFYWLKALMKKVFPAILLSILLSKLVYYAAKYFIISFGLLEMSLVSTPLYIQAITTVIFSTYLFVVFRYYKGEK